MAVQTSRIQELTTLSEHTDVPKFNYKVGQGNNFAGTSHHGCGDIWETSWKKIVSSKRTERGKEHSK